MSIWHIYVLEEHDKQLFSFKIFTKLLPRHGFKDPNSIYCCFEAWRYFLLYLTLTSSVVINRIFEFVNLLITQNHQLHLLAHQWFQRVFFLMRSLTVAFLLLSRYCGYWRGNNAVNRPKLLFYCDFISFRDKRQNSRKYLYFFPHIQFATFLLCFFVFKFRRSFTWTFLFAVVTLSRHLADGILWRCTSFFSIMSFVLLLVRINCFIMKYINKYHDEKPAWWRVKTQ